MMKKIVSYSLYNNRPKDCINAIINCLLIPQIYPGWVARFYIDDTVPPSIEQLLRTFEHVEVVVMPHHRGSEAMLWRFLPASEYDTVMISRDADSWVSVREKVCVDQWLEGDRSFHIIRDHCYHSQKIMGGMWGVRNYMLPEMKDLVEEFCKTGTYDQGFLAEKIYPNVTHNLLVHFGNPQYNNQGQLLVNGYFGEDGHRAPIPSYQEWDEPVPGLSFREANSMNAFHCAHCRQTHPVLIGGITEHIPPRALEVVRNYAREKGIVLDAPGI
jgi:hypothetical protein